MFSTSEIGHQQPVVGKRARPQGRIRWKRLKAIPVCVRRMCRMMRRRKTSAEFRRTSAQKAMPIVISQVSEPKLSANSSITRRRSHLSACSSGGCCDVRRSFDMGADRACSRIDPELSKGKLNAPQMSTIANVGIGGCASPAEQAALTPSLHVCVTSTDRMTSNSAHLVNR
jgi:hypothetical protein